MTNELEIFSQAWTDAWAERLNASESYAKSAATWEGSLVLAMNFGDRGADRSVYLDLYRGACREARVASSEDLERAAFVIRADAGFWRQLMEGRVDPIFAIMSGRLRLVRGQMARLVPFVAAAKSLVSEAAALGGTFPQPGGELV